MHPAPSSPSCPSTDPSIRAGLNESGLYERETRFYEEIVPQVELSTPRCFYSATDGEAGDHVLSLEDLAPTPVGDALAVCSDGDADLAMREIASFHAAFWGSPRLTGLDWIPSFDDRVAMMQEGYRRRWDPFLAKLGDVLTPTLLEIGRRFGGNVAGIMSQLGESPRTIIHGNYRLDNFIFGTPVNGRPLTIIDWQVPLIGPGVADIAYFVGFCIDPERRRATELGLLRKYHSALSEFGVSSYDFEACLKDYRLSLVYHLTRVMAVRALLDISSERRQQLVIAVLDRLDSALSDHKVMELMPG